MPLRCFLQQLQEGLDEASEVATAGRASFDISSAAVRVRVRKPLPQATFGLDVDLAGCNAQVKVRQGTQPHGSAASPLWSCVRRVQLSPGELSAETEPLHLFAGIAASCELSLSLPPPSDVSVRWRVVGPQLPGRHHKLRSQLNSAGTARAALCYDVPCMRLPETGATLRSKRARTDAATSDSYASANQGFTGSISADAGEVSVRMTSLDLELLV